MKWMVRRQIDDRFLCTDGKWRHCVADVRQIKFYSTANRAIKYGLMKVQPVEYHGISSKGTAYAVYEDDIIDRNGEIVEN